MVSEAKLDWRGWSDHMASLPPPYQTHLPLSPDPGGSFQSDPIHESFHFYYKFRVPLILCSLRGLLICLLGKMWERKKYMQNVESLMIDLHICVTPNDFEVGL